MMQKIILRTANGCRTSLYHKKLVHGTAKSSDSVASLYGLSNGLRVVSEKRASPTSNVAIHVEAGTRHEKSSNNGVSNFISRLVGKGTKNDNQSKIESQLSKMGAVLSVDVGKEITTFSIDGFSKDYAKHVAILSDIVKNAIYEESAIEKERSTILQDLDLTQSDYSQIVADHLYAVSFQGTPLAHSLFGPTRNIKSIGRKDILDFIDNNYKAPRMVLTSVGDINQGALAEEAEKHLSDVSYKYPGDVDLVNPCRFTGSEVQHRDDDLPVAYTSIGLKGCAVDSPDRMPLMLITAMTGTHEATDGGFSHVFNDLSKIIQSPGVGAHYFGAFCHFYSDTGLFGVNFVGEPEVLDDLGLVTGRFWMNLAHNVLDGALERGKRNLRYHLIRNEADKSQVSKRIAENALFGDCLRDGLEDELDSVNRISANDVMRVATHYIQDRDFGRAAYGATEAITDYNRMRSALYWLRW